MMKHRQQENSGIVTPWSRYLLHGYTVIYGENNLPLHELSTTDERQCNRSEVFLHLAFIGHVYRNTVHFTQTCIHLPQHLLRIRNPPPHCQSNQVEHHLARAAKCIMTSLRQRWFTGRVSHSMSARDASPAANSASGDEFKAGRAFIRAHERHH